MGRLHSQKDGSSCEQDQVIPIVNDRRLNDHQQIIVLFVSLEKMVFIFSRRKRLDCLVVRIN